MRRFLLFHNGEREGEGVELSDGKHCIDFIDGETQILQQNNFHGASYSLEFIDDEELSDDLKTGVVEKRQ